MKNSSIKYSSNQGVFLAMLKMHILDRLLLLLRVLFSGNGYLYVNKDLSSEYSYTYTGIKLCIADRRDSGICATLTITVCK